MDNRKRMKDDECRGDSTLRIHHLCGLVVKVLLADIALGGRFLDIGFGSGI